MNATAARWIVNAKGFHVDPRLSAAGFIAGVTTKSFGNMAESVYRLSAVEALGLGQTPSYFLRQVHGAAVHDLSRPDADSLDGDGWLVQTQGRVAGIYSADCTPIYLWDRQGRAAAVLHSGWKGTKANIAVAGVAALQRRGIAVADISAAIGPRIGKCCYAVGDDFESHFHGSSLERRGGKLFFDLGAQARAQLVEAGVEAESISLSEGCTCCGGEFYSFRRDKQSTRMAAFLAASHG